MKSKSLLLFIGSSCFVSPLFTSLIDSASAQCIQQHLGIQLDISNQKNTRQAHALEMSSNLSCSGNTSSSNSTQSNIGGDGAEQSITGRHSTTSPRPNPTGVDAPTIKNPVVIPVPVKTPNTPINFP